MKKIILRLLSCAIVVALLAVFVIFVGIPLFAEEKTVHDRNPNIMYYEGDTKKPLTMENDKLAFELDPATTHFKVTEKETGREWLSNPADADKDKIAVSANKETLQATAIVTYSTSSGTVDLNNYKYSIENGNYGITQLDDGAIRVDYAIGKIEKIFMMPTAITKERYDAFVEQMKSSTKKKLSSNYTLYKPEELDKKKNKDEKKINESRNQEDVSARSVHAEQVAKTGKRWETAYHVRVEKEKTIQAVDYPDISIKSVSKEGVEFATLTDIITREWSDMRTKEYKKLKGLKKENLRDNMTNVELALNILAEASTAEISKQKNPHGFKQNVTIAREGGSVAKVARKQLEEKLGRSVISSSKATDFLPPPTEEIE